MFRLPIKKSKKKAVESVEENKVQYEEEVNEIILNDFIEDVRKTNDKKSEKKSFKNKKSSKNNVKKSNDSDKKPEKKHSEKKTKTPLFKSKKKQNTHPKEKENSTSEVESKKHHNKESSKSIGIKNKKGKKSNKSSKNAHHKSSERNISEVDAYINPQIENYNLDEGNFQIFNRFEDTKPEIIEEKIEEKVLLEEVIKSDNKKGNIVWSKDKFPKDFR